MRACRRFSEFDLLHKLVKSSFSAKLNKSKEFVMPNKPKKTWMKHFDERSVQLRRLVQTPPFAARNPSLLGLFWTELGLLCLILTGWSWRRTCRSSF